MDKKISIKEKRKKVIRTSFVFADIGIVASGDSSAVGSALPLRVGCRCGSDVAVAAALQSAQLAKDGVQIDILGICNERANKD